jgi:arylsulfatase A-like enzyme
VPSSPPIIATCAAGLLALGALGTAPAAACADVQRDAITKHVIVISVDGLRPDAIAAFDARVMQRLLREGAYSLDAQTVYPSKTLPSHTSMLTGVVPEVHGITWNSDRTAGSGVMETPTIFELARRGGLSTAAFFSKAKLRHLQKRGTLDHSQAPAGLEVYTATRTVEDAVRYMRFRKPSLLFVHIAEPDAAGHNFGWMGRAYGLAVRRADGAVGQILAAAEGVYGAGGYTVILTSDHGGHGRDHGSDDAADMLIPWIAWGAGVEPGELREPVRTVDTAATALWLLGVPFPQGWDGKAVASAFTAAARALAAGNGAALPF